MSMAATPNTRASLIARLSDSQDVEAWQEFVEIYLPLLYRLARRKGVQHADAEELGQEVLIAVSRAIHRWEPDPETVNPVPGGRVWLIIQRRGDNRFFSEERLVAYRRALERRLGRPELMTRLTLHLDRILAKQRRGATHSSSGPAARNQCR